MTKPAICQLAAITVLVPGKASRTLVQGLVVDLAEELVPAQIGLDGELVPALTLADAVRGYLDAFPPPPDASALSLDPAFTDDETDVGSDGSGATEE